MNLFDDILHEIRNFVDARKDKTVTRMLDQHIREWPKAKGKNLVLTADTAVELGNPRTESVSFVLWTQNPSAIVDNVFHLIGNDIAEAEGKSLPFGKVVMLAVEGMNESNCYDRHRAIELARYDLELEGYMLRAASQYLREWSRVSKTAVAHGFSFSIFANELSRVYRAFEFVSAVECLFVTSSCDDVRELYELGSKVERRIAAMNKMHREMDFDCSRCEFTDVCSEVEGLRFLRNREDTINHENRIS
ncbi:MAG: hypothetical protein N2316_04775 [Spirochaetes bacterium]|nr:hypothetical protein [Spirochaetota bacterium]